MQGISHHERQLPPVAMKCLSIGASMANAREHRFPTCHRRARYASQKCSQIRHDWTFEKRRARACRRRLRPRRSASRRAWFTFHSAVPRFAPLEALMKQASERLSAATNLGCHPGPLVHDKLA